MTRFEAANNALKEAMRDAEKEAARLEITIPDLSKEARARADGLADARVILNSLSDLSIALSRMEDAQ